MKAWYKGKVPPDVLADNLQCTVEEAKEFIKEFAVLPAKPKRMVRKPVTNMHTLALFILPWASGIIALLSMARSTVFTYNYFVRTDAVWSAVLMAILFSMVAYISLSVAIHAVKTKRWIIAIASTLIFGLFAYLNVYITVQELNYMKTLNEVELTNEQEQIVVARNRVATIEADIEDYGAKYKIAEAEYDVVLEKSNTPEIAITEYNRHRTNLDTIKGKLAGYEARVVKLKEERDSLTNLKGYYTLEVLTMEDKEQARQMDAVYAFSLEIVGAVFTAIAIFL